jgi:hypothetical protein
MLGGMKLRLAAILFVVAMGGGVAVTSSSPVDYPKAPEAAVVGRLLRLDQDALRIPVTLDKAEDQNGTKDGKIVWEATYHVQSKPAFFVHVTLVRAGMIKTASMEDIANHPELEFQKLTEPNGDVIYHFLGNRGGDQGTIYSTNLITHQKDWDLMVILGVGPGVEEKALPIHLEKDGIAFVRKLNEQLRAK